MTLAIAFYAPMKPPDHERPSGDRTIARHVITALERAGHTVHVISRFRSWAEAPDIQVRLRMEARHELRALSETLARSRPDVWLTYHLSYKAPDWLGPALCRRFGVPYLVAEASDAPSRAGGPWAEGVADVRRALAGADAVLLLKERDRCALECLPGIAPKLIRLPPFLDMADWTEIERGGRQGPVRLLAAAMMRPGDKLASYRLLAASLSHLREPWHLTVAGDGPARGEVETLFRPFGSRVRFAGLAAPATMRALCHEADILVWPGLGEGIGMAYLEAQATGLPVAACHTAGVPEVVRHGITGWLCPPDDPRALAAAIGRLADDPAGRLGMGRMAAAYVRARHGIDAGSIILHRVLTEAASVLRSAAEWGGNRCAR